MTLLIQELGLAKHLQNALLRHAHYMLNVCHLPQPLQLSFTKKTIFHLAVNVPTPPLPEHQPNNCLNSYTFNLTTLMSSPFAGVHVMCSGSCFYVKPKKNQNTLNLVSLAVSSNEHTPVVTAPKLAV